jgi:N-acetylglucosamine-6-phosphate deacetylase
MNLNTNSHIDEMIINDENIQNVNSNSFIESNTNQVEINHLKKDCIVPSFCKGHGMYYRTPSVC